jgi:hypothetical protein
LELAADVVWRKRFQIEAVVLAESTREKDKDHRLWWRSTGRGSNFSQRRHVIAT